MIDVRDCFTSADRHRKGKTGHDDFDELIEVPQVLHIDQVIDVLVAMEGHVLVIQTVQRTAEVPQVQFIDRIVDPKVQFIDKVVYMPAVISTLKELRTDLWWCRVRCPTFSRLSRSSRPSARPWLNRNEQVLMSTVAQPPVSIS